MPPRRSTPDTAIVTTLLRLVVERGWRHVSLLDIARAGGFPLADLYRRFPSKEAILAAFSRDLDAKMLAGDDAGADTELPRERLLDVILRRFEAMASYREPVRVLMRDLPRDPVAVARLRPAILEALGAMLEGAGLDSSGLRGAVRRRVLGIAFLQACRVWLGDETPDLSRTTAELDRRLRRLSRALGLPDRTGNAAPGGGTGPGWSPEADAW